MRILIVVLFIALPSAVLAAARGSSSADSTVAAPAESTSTAAAYDVRRREMPSAFRLGLVGAYVVTPPLSGYENKEVGDKSAGFLALMAGIGDGMLSLEAGVGTLKTSDVAILPEHRYLVNSQYYAFPVWAKYNYIERSLASFFVKAGVIPITLIKQDSAINEVSSEKNGMLAVVGIGGTTSLTDSIAFVLDVTGYQNLGGRDALGAENRGIPKQFVSVGLGLSLEL